MGFSNETFRRCLEYDVISGWNFNTGKEGNSLMANFKIFQDNPDQVRVKIFGNNNTALNTDSLGNLTITSTGLAITAPADGLSITSTGLAITAPTNGLTVTASADGLAITPPANGLSITSTGLAITAPTNGLTVTASADGLAITPPSGGLMVTGSLVTSLGTTDVSAVRANITDTAGSADETYNVLNIRTWTFGVVNASLAANAQALVKLQISPDATHWIDESSSVTINQNGVASLVSSVFMKYARVYYSAVNAASAVTLNIFFQGEI